MENKFTPGPWKVGYRVAYGWDIGPSPLKWAASVNDGDILGAGDGEGLANAHLIAAAPDMYEALKEALATIEYVKEYVEGMGLSAEDDCNNAIEIINAAIAKADGEENE